VRKLLAIAVALALLGFGPPLGARLFGWGPDRSTLPPPAQAVSIGDGLALNVVDLAGNGTPIVLVHGLPSNVGDWAALPQKLAALGHRVVVYDRIGYGWSSRSPIAGDAYTYASSARELGALLDALGVGQAILVGWSYGGAVAQSLAAAAPARVARLVLLGSVGPALPPASRSDDPVARLTVSPVGGAILDWVAAVPPLARAMTRSALAQAFSSEASIPAGFVEREMAQLAMPGTLDAYIAEERRAEPETLRPEAIAAPTLILHGTDDRAVPPRVAEDLHQRIPGSELALVPGGSHMLPITHADLLAGSIHGWAEGSR